MSLGFAAAFDKEGFYGVVWLGFGDGVLGCQLSVSLSISNL